MDDGNRFEVLGGAEAKVELIGNVCEDGSQLSIPVVVVKRDDGASHDGVHELGVREAGPVFKVIPCEVGNDVKSSSQVHSELFGSGVVLGAHQLDVSGHAGLLVADHKTFSNVDRDWLRVLFEGERKDTFAADIGTIVEVDLLEEREHLFVEAFACESLGHVVKERVDS